MAIGPSLAAMLADRQLRGAPGPKRRQPPTSWPAEAGKGALRALLDSPGDLLDLLLGASTAGAPETAEQAGAPLPQMSMYGRAGKDYLPQLAPAEGLLAQLAGFGGELLSPDPLDILKIAGMASPLLTRAPDIAAWHGGPHKFKKFSTDKIGTGEGAQAYGWGLYFGGKREVGEAYRSSLGGAGVLKGSFGETGPGQRKWGGANPERVAREDVVFGMQADPGADLESVVRMKRETARKDVEYRATVKEYQTPIGADDISMSEFSRRKLEEMDRLLADRSLAYEPGGALYKVDLAPDDDDLLDWDLPLSEQSEKVKKATRKAGFGQLLDDNPDAPGRALYQTMSALLGTDPKEASRTLNSLGIPGIRYKDQMSRYSVPQKHRVQWNTEGTKAVVFDTSTEKQIKTFDTFKEADEWVRNTETKLGINRPTYNYVIFDDKLIDILPEVKTPRGPLQTTPKLKDYIRLRGQK